MQVRYTGPTYHGARARHDLGGLPLGSDLAEAGPLSELLAGVHLSDTTTGQRAKIWGKTQAVNRCQVSKHQTAGSGRREPKVHPTS